MVSQWLPVSTSNHQCALVTAVNGDEVPNEVSAMTAFPKELSPAFQP
jgi:hypothetical protein